MDELKKYIQQHIKELDLDEPGPQVWQQVRQETGTVKKTSVVMLVTRWSAAACIIVLAGIGILTMLKDHKTGIVPSDTTASIPFHEPKTTLPSPATPAPHAIERPEVLASSATGPVSKHSRKPIVQPGNKPSLATLTEMENSFTQVINLQRARVSSTPMFAETPEYFRDFKIQIRQMEKDERAIKLDMAKHGMNDELLDQLITLYQQKLNILKQLQIEMNKTNNRFKQGRGPVDSTRTYFLNI